MQNPSFLKFVRHYPQYIVGAIILCSVEMYVWRWGLAPLLKELVSGGKDFTEITAFLDIWKIYPIFEGSNWQWALTTVGVGITLGILSMLCVVPVVALCMQYLRGKTLTLGTLLSRRAVRAMGVYTLLYGGIIVCSILLQQACIYVLPVHWIGFCADTMGRLLAQMPGVDIMQVNVYNLAASLMGGSCLLPFLVVGYLLPLLFVYELIVDGVTSPWVWYSRGWRLTWQYGLRLLVIVLALWVIMTLIMAVAIGAIKLLARLELPEIVSIAGAGLAALFFVLRKVCFIYIVFRRVGFYLSSLE